MLERKTLGMHLEFICTWTNPNKNKSATENLTIYRHPMNAFYFGMGKSVIWE